MQIKNWKNKRVFITGAGGFIGSHLTENLVMRGANVRALVHYNSRNHWGHLESIARERPRNLEIVPGDIRDSSLMANLIAGREIVFHLAALIPIPYSYMAPQSFVETNVMGTLNVLEASRKAKVEKFIHTSTSEVYGTARYVPIDEDHPLQGQSPYAATKIGADQLVRSYHDSFGFPSLIIRPFNTFGPRQSARAIIPTVLASLLGGQRQIKLGDLRPIRDFNFVQDTVSGFILGAESPVVGRAINIGSGRGWTVKQVVRKCAEVLALPPPVLLMDPHRLRPQKSEVWRLVCDNRAAKRMLKWSPKKSFEDGLAEVAAYIKAHIEQYKGNIYNI